MSPYGHLLDMPASAEFYDAIHAETLRRTQGDVDGLLVHVARRTATGFQVIEVWTDRDSFQRANQEILTPIMASVAGSAQSAAGPPQVEEFVPRGLVIPGGRLVF
jgi:hypothetical protein